MKVEIRDTGEVHISGYVNAVERLSKTLPPEMAESAAGAPFREKIQAGAFARAVAENPSVEWLFNHSRRIGSTATGEITLREDNIGLRADGVTADPEVVEAARNGQLTGWSFGFCAPVDDWDRVASPQERTLTGFRLSEVSILTLPPAYIGTTAEVRALGETNTLSVRFNEDGGAPPSYGDSGGGDSAARIPDSLPAVRREVEILKLKGEFFA